MTSPRALTERRRCYRHVPADAEPLTEATIQLTAASDANDAGGGFNSARKTYLIVSIRAY